MGTEQRYPVEACSSGRNYPGLDFKFTIDGLSKDHLRRLDRSLEDCRWITRLVSAHKILKKQMIHLTMWRDPISVLWNDPKADEAVRERYKKIKCQNILELYNGISARADAGEQIPVTIEQIFVYHQQLLKGIPQDPSRPAGQFRKSWMKVGGNIIVGCCCKEVPAYMEKLFWWLESPAFKSTKQSSLAEAFIKAIVGHMYFITIHPFFDGNGTLSRLFQYSILRNAGVPAGIAHLLGNYYNETRNEYCETLNLARSTGDVTIFLDYALTGLNLKLREYLKDILQSLPERIKEEVKSDKFALAKGFTILEILVVLSVIAILIGIAVPRFKGMQDEAGMVKAKSELKAIVAAVESYKMNHGSYPDNNSVQDGCFELGDSGSSCVLHHETPQIVNFEDLNDPWGRRYKYFRPDEDLRYYVVYSSGPEMPAALNGSQCGVSLGANIDPKSTSLTDVAQPVGCRCIFETNVPNVELIRDNCVPNC